jgi:hypothetical protein
MSATATTRTETTHTALEPSRVLSAKFAYTTRHVEQQVRQRPEGYHLTAGDAIRPRPGDVILAQVVEIGHHARLESPASRRAMMFPGDEIVVAYGHRYAPDQFEAEVPADLGQTHLAAAGGVAGHVTAAMLGTQPPTVLQPLGLLTHPDGKVVNLKDFAPHVPLSPAEIASLNGDRKRTPVIAVLGTSMNAGKSTTVASLARGLTRAGQRVAAGKITGTGAGGDPGMYRDGGAATVLDFTDFGFASTYRLGHGEVRAVFASMIHELAATGADVVIVEIADGTYQLETQRLMADPLFTEYVDHVLFSAADALGAVAGLQTLRDQRIAVAAVSGRFTSAPLSVREARGTIDVPVLDAAELSEPGVAASLVPAARGCR